MLWCSISYSSLAWTFSLSLFYLIITNKFFAQKQKEKPSVTSNSETRTSLMSKRLRVTLIFVAVPPLRALTRRRRSFHKHKQEIIMSINLPILSEMDFLIEDFIHPCHAMVGVIPIQQLRTPSFLDLQKIKIPQYL